MNSVTPWGIQTDLDFKPYIYSFFYFQIRKFLLGNLQQNKKFSAYGFFDIDNSVLYMASRIENQSILINYNNQQ